MCPRATCAPCVVLGVEVAEDGAVVRHRDGQLLVAQARAPHGEVRAGVVGLQRELEQQAAHGGVAPVAHVAAAA